MATGTPDTKSHYGVIIIGAGVSGLAMDIQLKRKLGHTDVLVYERDTQLGGTWWANTYPGAGVDIPFSLYSFSFAKSITADMRTQWADQETVLKYIQRVKEHFHIQNIVFQTEVSEARWNESTGLWTVHVTNLATGEKATKTCNVLISAVGGLREPSIPKFAANSDFSGEVFHSARWNHDVDLTGKNIVVVGNGCSAAQIVPEIVAKSKSVTQVARSKQALLPRPKLPDGGLWWFFVNYIPGLMFLQRFIVFLGSEYYFKLSHLKRGAGLRGRQLKILLNYVKTYAPKKYWDAMTPDFDVGAKRRIFDTKYIHVLKNKKFDLIQDDAVVAMKDRTVTTEKGVTIDADVVVLSTGFRVQDYFFPLKLYDDHGNTLLDKLNSTGAKQYRGTFSAGFPNFATIMGPNTATGHSSVIFTSECQIDLILKVLGPVLVAAQKRAPSTKPAPSVAVTSKAEDEYYQKLRKAMAERVWEKDGGVSWYVDSETRLCTALYPWSQMNFWWHSKFPVKSHYQQKNF